MCGSRFTRDGTSRSPRFAAGDGLTRVRAGVHHRLLHHADRAVEVRVAQLSCGTVLFGARSGDRDSALYGIERMRAALGVDLDLRPFYDRFHRDPLIGAAVRADPGLRVNGRPDPFEALCWAICEQLIEYERAVAIERRLVRALGRRPRRTDRRANCAMLPMRGCWPAARRRDCRRSASPADAPSR